MGEDSSEEDKQCTFFFVKSPSSDNMTHHMLKEAIAKAGPRMPDLVIYTFDVSEKVTLDYVQALCSLTTNRAAPNQMQLMIYNSGWAGRRESREPWNDREGQVLKQMPQDCNKVTLVFSSLTMCRKNLPTKNIKTTISPKTSLERNQLIELLQTSIEVAEQWRSMLRERAIDRAFELAARKLSILIPWSDTETTADDKVRLTFGIKRYHQQIFTAAGDMETVDQYTKDYDTEMGLSQFTDLLLRETICLLAEQIQNAPSRINNLFHMYRKQVSKDHVLTEEHLKEIQDLSGKEDEIDTDTDVLAEPYYELFIKRWYYDSMWSNNCLNKRLHEIIDLDEIKNGIRSFTKSEMNFDDIEDSSRWKEDNLSRTFREPFSVMVLFVVVLKYAPEIITFKLWMIYGLYAMTHNFVLPSSTIITFVTVDLVLMWVFFVGSWIIRIAITYGNSCNCLKYLKPVGSQCASYSLIIRLSLDGLAAVAGLGVIVAFASMQGGDLISEIGPGMEACVVYYFAIRVAFSCIGNLLPTAQLQKTRFGKASKRRGKFRIMSTRAVFRILFMACFIGITGVYEYFLIVSGFDDFTDTSYCGSRTYVVSQFTMSTQYFLCTMTQVLIWVVACLGIAIDNGLAFTFLMSVFGFLRGTATQGEARGNVKLSRQELDERIRNRFAIHAGEKTAQVPEKVWRWAVNCWRQLDIISNEEREHLRTSPIIDVTQIVSPQARENIGFWINSLTIKPNYYAPFKEIPKTSILIPVYSEKLEFPWKEEPAEPYLPLFEAPYLVAKFPHHWLNLQERLKELGEDVDEKVEITDWLSMHDQLVYRTVRGAASYFESLVLLAELEGIPFADAMQLSKEKIEIILCVQIYQKRYFDVKDILKKWMDQWPFLKIVFDFTRTKNMPAEFCNPANIPLVYDYASCMICYENGKLKYTVYPREFPLLIANLANSRVQGKAMNQLNGLTFATGAFIQVLDANQGGHATEYAKFPSLIYSFKLNPDNNDASIRKRIIGSREYVFTGHLGTVASFHAYQEWSFGTLVLRVYSDLGIRLHYGHPDVFHGPWAWAHSGLSKINPDINTSEDVFAGMEAMLCKERATHVEHIQFEKGRETGLANMTSFDTKISAGNAGLLRSRDIFNLMERLSFLKRFLFFYGITGHFITTSLMVMSLNFYIWTMFIFSMSGVSLEALGGTIFSTEWIIHAGFTTAVPLLAELLVERGVLVGLFDAILFIPISTIVYLFQMQTKHNAFTEGIVTGKSAHINTGRGLAIYRQTLRLLYTNYSQTHYMPMFNIVMISAAYWSISGEVGGGSLPLIMIYVFVSCVICSPQLFNPTLQGNTIYELIDESAQFIGWIGKATIQTTIDDWKLLLKHTNDEEDFMRFWLKRDIQYLPNSTKDSVGMAIYRLVFVFFWLFVVIFLLYPQMQVWFSNFMFYWMLLAIVYWICMVPIHSMQLYLNPISNFLWLVGIVLLIVGIAQEAAHRRVSGASIYVAGFITAKLLQSFRSFLLTLTALVAHYKFSKKDVVSERTAFIYSNTLIINKLFMVNTLRTTLAMLWLILAFAIALVMRPLWANLFLFGRYNGQETGIELRRNNKSIVLQSPNFKTIQTLPPKPPNIQKNLLESSYAYEYMNKIPSSLPSRRQPLFSMQYDPNSQPTSPRPVRPRKDKRSKITRDISTLMSSVGIGSPKESSRKTKLRKSYAEPQRLDQPLLNNDRTSLDELPTDSLRGSQKQNYKPPLLKSSLPHSSSVGSGLTYDT